MFQNYAVHGIHAMIISSRYILIFCGMALYFFRAKCFEHARKSVLISDIDGYVLDTSDSRHIKAVEIPARGKPAWRLASRHQRLREILELHREALVIKRRKEEIPRLCSFCRLRLTVLSSIHRLSGHRSFLPTDRHRFRYGSTAILNF